MLSLSWFLATRRRSGILPRISAQTRCLAFCCQLGTFVPCWQQKVDGPNMWGPGLLQSVRGKNPGNFPSISRENFPGKFPKNPLWCSLFEPKNDQHRPKITVTDFGHFLVQKASSKGQKFRKYSEFFPGIYRHILAEIAEKFEFFEISKNSKNFFENFSKKFQKIFQKIFEKSLRGLSMALVRVKFFTRTKAIKK